MPLPLAFYFEEAAHLTSTLVPFDAFLSLFSSLCRGLRSCSSRFLAAFDPNSNIAESTKAERFPRVHLSAMPLSIASSSIMQRSSSAALASSPPPPTLALMSRLSKRWPMRSSASGSGASSSSSSSSTSSSSVTTSTLSFATVLTSSRSRAIVVSRSPSPRHLERCASGEFSTSLHVRITCSRTRQPNSSVARPWTSFSTKSNSPGRAAAASSALRFSCGFLVVGASCLSLVFGFGRCTGCSRSSMCFGTYDALLATNICTTARCPIVSVQISASSAVVEAEISGITSCSLSSFVSSTETMARSKATQLSGSNAISAACSLSDLTMAFLFFAEP
mmetsp:Transcript_7252/g.9953  ORF Transcript_7252/g.9953 Transcript_7252/m.9953 type:complete len:334 (-) Transcript_7252:100-1101(-)